jgi:site-specific recombinase XerD
LSAFSADLADDIRAYISHRSRAWRPEQQRQTTLNLLSHLTGTLRGLEVADIRAVTPALWLDYVETRLQSSIRPGTLNRELYDLQDFLRFQAELGRPICERMLAVEPLDTGDPLPRDVPVGQLRQLLHQIQQEIDTEVERQRQALMDRAWVLLMLHSGLRTGEIRHLRLDDLDLARKQARIEQGKGLQDRIVFLSREGVEALKAYLTIRGPAATDHLFIYRHRPLSSSYCRQRLHNYGQRSGLHITPHQLRYSCATLLLNAGAPTHSVTVQRILGHQNVETTLRYAQLYDGTVVNDYRRAMGEFEGNGKEQK